ncbi:MAG: TIGR03862 family flavoprotein [Paracoccus sp. (in: a-proteobacteria)]|uniref:TIGR03862 family flavoprotein n=1 Tax=Paracoccus sp. TaxID=267 RepID=UPI0026E0783F|nr:TIGR03862 family flavoprotein [Paracoccus sp. (in: a-proteobacteria)]MDO5619981.1 TIGR03862 family flavoprotein [Paracoccus sp. (in: a-proteobacteria)]
MSQQALVIGAGPAGLMAAGVLAAGGAQVILAEAMPTPARKFLMAGKSGLNLTRHQPLAEFAAQVSMGATDAQLRRQQAILADFGPDQVQDWARGLGVDLFTGSTGRVFPVGMKASPLLRAWLARLRGAGVDLRTRWRWRGFAGDGFAFDTPAGPQVIRPGACVLALGGASWPRLGSDAAWVPWLAARGVPVVPFQPANMGFFVDWSAPMARHFGAAVKGVAIRAGGQLSRGEWVITRDGIEGGGVYTVAAALREGAAATVDLAPDLDAAALAGRFARPRGKLSVGNWLRRVLGDPVRAALLLEWGQPLPGNPLALAIAAKALPLRHRRPMGLARAISSAGGIGWDGLDDDLQLRAIPGCFAAGEMLDWEAPTGGYLLTFSMASGRLAARGALARLRTRQMSP